MKLRYLIVFFVFLTGVLSSFSVDRKAFTFTNYDLKVRVDPGQQRLGVRGKITLRNDSASAQKIAVLQKEYNDSRKLLSNAKIEAEADAELRSNSSEQYSCCFGR